jgi:hypothetical protein
MKNIPLNCLTANLLDGTLTADEAAVLTSRLKRRQAVKERFQEAVWTTANNLRVLLRPR